MEKDIDQITKDIFADSKLELKNPHFNSRVLSRITIDLERKARRRLSVVYVLIFSTIAIAAGLVITIFKIDVHGQLRSLVNSQHLGNVWPVVLQNGYCFLLIFLILAGKKMIAPDYKNSRKRYRIR